MNKSDLLSWCFAARSTLSQEVLDVRFTDEDGVERRSEVELGLHVLPLWSTTSGWDSIALLRRVVEAEVLPGDAVKPFALDDALMMRYGMPKLPPFCSTFIFDEPVDWTLNSWAEAVGRVKFGSLPIRTWATRAADGALIVVGSFEVKERDSGTTVYITSNMQVVDSNVENAAEVAFQVALSLLTHELQEQFTVDGVRTKDPHR